MEMISGPEKMLHRDRLKDLNLFSLLKWRLRGDCSTAYQYLHMARMLGINVLFNLAGKGTSRTNGWELKPDKFKLQIRHNGEDD